MAKPRIRIIDDDEESCSEIADALMACGYDCSWANPPDFMAGPNEPDPDILILDLSMPRIDGFQVIQNLAGAGRQPHLIVAS
ncbi:response regulator [Sphingomonas sp. HH69]